MNIHLGPFPFRRLEKIWLWTNLTASGRLSKNSWVEGNKCSLLRYYDTGFCHSGYWWQFRFTWTAWHGWVVQCNLPLSVLLNWQNKAAVFSEDDPDLIIRTKELYSEHCNALAQDPTLAPLFGLKRSCPLNSLQFFHPSDNYAVEIMQGLCSTS